MVPEFAYRLAAAANVLVGQHSVSSMLQCVHSYPVRVNLLAVPLLPVCCATYRGCRAERLGPESASGCPEAGPGSDRAASASGALYPARSTFRLRSAR